MQVMHALLSETREQRVNSSSGFGDDVSESSRLKHNVLN